MTTRIALVSLGVALPLVLTACETKSAIAPPPEAKQISAGPSDIAKLQRLATRSCQCARKTREDHYEPITAWDVAHGRKAQQPTPCWQEFAEALQPFKFDYAPVSACGPGSDVSALEIGDQIVTLHHGFGTCSEQEADAALRAYEAKSDVGGCS